MAAELMRPKVARFRARWRAHQGYFSVDDDCA